MHFRKLVWNDKNKCVAARNRRRNSRVNGSRIHAFAVRLNRLGCFSEGRYWAIPRNRATLFLAINLAVRAGYKNIVMCGVDLNNTDYFFRADSFAASLSGLCVPPANQFGAVHKTNDPHYGELTISVILDVFDKIVLQPRGIKLVGYPDECG